MLKKNIIIFLIIISTFFIDLLTKNFALNHLIINYSLSINNFLNFTLAFNYGAAFSILSEAGGWQRWFFTAIAMAVSGVILWWLKQSPKNQTLLPVAFSFILGGALGNVYDRLVHGYVIDFLDFYVNGFHWPAFNIADSAIFIGAALLIIDMIKNGDKNKKTDAPNTSQK